MIPEIAKPDRTHPPQSTIGKITGSNAWTTSGQHDMAHAKASMQAATEGRNPEKDGYGKVEEMVGKLTGCGGMQHEGAASAQAKQNKPRSD